MSGARAHVEQAHIISQKTPAPEQLDELVIPVAIPAQRGLGIRQFLHSVIGRGLLCVNVAAGTTFLSSYITGMKFFDRRGRADRAIHSQTLLSVGAMLPLSCDIVRAAIIAQAIGNCHPAKAVGAYHRHA